MTRKLLVLNPNTTEAMTRRVVVQAQQLLGSSVTVRGCTASAGPEVIATRQAYAEGAAAALATWRLQRGWADAVLLACFGDPGLEALRAESAVPVIGMAEAALREAHALAGPYRIVTAGADWVGLLQEVAERCGCSRWLDRVVALETTGLAISRDPAAFMALLQQTLDDASAARISTVVLGGSGFAGLRPRLHFDGVLIDGTEAACRSAAIAISAGLR